MKINKVIANYKHCYKLFKRCSKNNDLDIYEFYFLNFIEFIIFLKKLNKIKDNKHLINNKEIKNKFFMINKIFDFYCFEQLIKCNKRYVEKNKDLMKKIRILKRLEEKNIEK